MKRLEYIVCKNFKAFYGTAEDPKSNKIVLDGKNLLLYGENGSGKSSLYWALYTIMMSALRKTSDSQNMLGGDYTLRPDSYKNRYSTSSDETSISIKFESKDEIKISNINSTLSPAESDFIQESILLSDFVNYKFIFKSFDFESNAEVDLFPLFEKELLPFMNFEARFSDAFQNMKFASQSWDYLLKKNDTIAKTIGSIRDIVLDMNQVIMRFNPAFQEYILRLISQTNDILADDFHCDLSISLKYEGCKVGDNGLESPKILLTLENSLLSSNNPQSLLNEAKLTQIAIALRFAIVLDKVTSSNYGRLLVLDDLLISLDMSNRDIVLDLILKCVQDSQIIFLTHDRALYNLAKRRIENRELKDSWIFKEMYHYEREEKINSDNTRIVPLPKIIDTKSYLDIAYKYIQECDYPASANYLRKACEEIMFNILPDNLIYSLDKMRSQTGQDKVNNSVENTEESNSLVSIESNNSLKESVIHSNDKGGSKIFDCFKLVDNFINMICVKSGINTTQFTKLDEYRKYLLNPLSHNNYEIPLYKSELVGCYELLKNLKDFKYQRLVNGNTSFFIRFEDEDPVKQKDICIYKYEFISDDAFLCRYSYKNVITFSDPMFKIFQYKDGKLLDKKGRLCTESTSEEEKFFEERLHKSIEETVAYLTRKGFSIKSKELEDIAYIEKDGQKIFLKDIPQEWETKVSENILCPPETQGLER